jgi:hypothetical protein
VSPLLRSEDGDLSTCQGLEFDLQVSFLRHRFCGVLQRGNDRLWPVNKKACLFAFLFVGDLPGTTAELTQRVADHFVEWLLNPPVVVFTAEEKPSAGAPSLTRLAGAIEGRPEAALNTALGPLFAAASDESAWELSQRKGTWKPG